MAASKEIDSRIVHAGQLGDAGRQSAVLAKNAGGVLPLAAAGLAAGTALAFARGLGEFGATIMFAGSLQGRTQTLPLAIYAEFDSNFDTALAIGGLLVAVSAVLLLSLQLGFRWKRSDSTSASRFAPSA